MVVCAGRVRWSCTIFVRFIQASKSSTRMRAPQADLTRTLPLGVFLLIDVAVDIAPVGLLPKKIPTYAGVSSIRTGS